MKDVREVVELMFKSSAPTLADLATVPRKAPKPLSGEARAAATAKATRVVRGTTSKKQKALLTGNVTGVSITHHDHVIRSGRGSCGGSRHASSDLHGPPGGSLGGQLVVSYFTSLLSWRSRP